ncbi:MAG: Multidrug resistance protein MdtH [Pelotomaculum sp. PtaB.Bin013]|nr:MAG: Multidrug resistance protein MdtH [Pelotomaculum sp. PtaB.Bin013]
MWNIILLGLVSLFTDISSEMIYPLVPLYLVGILGATPAIVGLIEGIAESLASLLKVFSGAVSDKFQKRKPLAIFGYGLSGLFKIPIILAVSWTWVLWGRIGDRFGKGVRTAPRDALIAESANPEKMGWSFGLHRMLDTLGAVIGVALAFYFFTKYEGNYKAVFIWSLVPASLGVGLLFLIREMKAKNEKLKKHFSANWRSLHPRLKKFLIVVFLFALGNSSNQFLLLRASELGYSAQSIILLYLVFNVIYALAAFPAGALSDRVGRRALLVAGYLFYGLVYLGFAIVSKGQYLWLLFGFYGVYNAVTEGVEKALVAEVSPDEQKATLLGLHATLVGIGLLPASIIGGALWKYFGPSATFYFGGFMGLLAAAGLAVVLAGENNEAVQ